METFSSIDFPTVAVFYCKLLIRFIVERQSQPWSQYGGNGLYRKHYSMFALLKPLNLAFHCREP